MREKGDYYHNQNAQCNEDAATANAAKIIIKELLTLTAKEIALEIAEKEFNEL